MENLNLEQFNPKKSELLSLADKYKSLEIKGLNDNEGYLAVDKGRKELKTARVEITKRGKELRDEAVKFQRAVISLEKELVGIIEPIEIELKNKQEKIDQERIMKQREALLPERKERLDLVGAEYTDELLLTMDNADFESFSIEQKSIFLEKKEQAILEAQAKIDAVNKRIAEEKHLEEQRKIAVEEAKKEAELEKQRAIEEEKRKAKEVEERMEREKREAVEAEKERAAKEKQAMIDEQARKDREAKEEADRKEREKLEAEAKAKAEQEALEKKKKYQKFLTDNKYNEETDLIFDKGDRVILARKVAEFIK
jgi:hypothetical protein